MFSTAKVVFSIVALVGVLGVGPTARSESGSDARAVNDALRILQTHDAERAEADGGRRQNFLYPTPTETLNSAEVKRFLAGQIPRLEAVHVRRSIMEPPERYPYFEGTFSRVYHPFVDRDVIAYDEGVYVRPGEEAYIGNFTYFPQRDVYSGDRVRSVGINGSIVFVGKRLAWDGRSENAMFIAEQVAPGFALNFVRATPAFLKGFEQRHAKAVAHQKKRLAQGQRGAGAGFGALLSIGLGAALIGGSDLSRLDKLDLAETFITDVASGGDGLAVFDQALEEYGATAGASGVFSGGQVFEAPGLNEAIDGMLNRAIRQ